MASDTKHLIIYNKLNTIGDKTRLSLTFMYCPTPLKRIFFFCILSESCGVVVDVSGRSLTFALSQISVSLNYFSHTSSRTRFIHRVLAFHHHQTKIPAHSVVYQSSRLLGLSSILRSHPRDTINQPSLWRGMFCNSTARL